MSPQPLRVLLAEPSQSQRTLACALLQAAGFCPAGAVTGPEALALTEDFRPHMILTELILPGFSGLELIRRCRARQSKAGIWAVTSASGTWAAQAALDAGADFLFYKPVYWPELIARLNRPAGPHLLRSVELSLEALGLDPRRAGFSQTARCIRMLAEDPTLLLKEIYLSIAREDFTSPAAVAKNVERCVAALRSSPLLPPGLPVGATGKDFLLSLAQAPIIPL